MICRRYFGAKTIWYLQFHVVCDNVNAFMFSSLYCGVTDIAVLYMKERTLHSLKLSGTPCIAGGFRKHKNSPAHK